MDKRKRVKRYLVGVIGLCFLLMFAPACVSAAKTANLVELKPGKTYKQYDITGDGKKDTVSLKQTKTYAENYETEIALKINGKKETIGAAKGITVYVFSAKRKGVLLAQCFAGTGECDVSQYIASKAKWSILGGGYNTECSVKRDKLSIIGSAKGPWWYKSFSKIAEQNYPPYKLEQRFVIKKGKLKHIYKYSRVVEKVSYKVSKRVKTGKTISSVGKGNGVSVPKNKKIRILAEYYNKKDGMYYFRIKYRGKEGWMPDNGKVQFLDA